MVIMSKRNIGAGKIKHCSQRKVRRNSEGGNTSCKQPPRHCSPWSPGKAPSHLGSGGEGISLTLLLKVFWPSIRSPFPFPEFLPPAMSGDLSLLNELLN